MRQAAPLESGNPPYAYGSIPKNEKPLGSEREVGDDGGGVSCVDAGRRSESRRMSEEPRFIGVHGKNTGQTHGCHQQRAAAKTPSSKERGTHGVNRRKEDGMHLIISERTGGSTWRIMGVGQSSVVVFAVPVLLERGEGGFDWGEGGRGVDLAGFEYMYTEWEGRTRTVSPGTTTTQSHGEPGDVASALTGASTRRWNKARRPRAPSHPALGASMSVPSVRKSCVDALHTEHVADLAPQHVLGRARLRQRAGLGDLFGRRGGVGGDGDGSLEAWLLHRRGLPPDKDRRVLPGVAEEGRGRAWERPQPSMNKHGQA
ncbi:hypothetical protein C8J57DRAFT_1481334 [Mycena rebaudengoi]|nr:hypothetical protein C8J57DRAFT_1481334 [Mycena rebaudengoi]